MAWIPGTDRNDTLADSVRDDFVSPYRGDDGVTLSGGHDMIEINPGDGHDTIAGFQTGEDTLLIENFNIFRAEDVVEHMTIDQTAGTITLDLSAADGRPAGTQTLTFTQGTGIKETDILINRGAIPFPDTLDLSLLGPADPEDPSFFPIPPNSPNYHVVAEEPQVSIGRAPPAPDPGTLKQIGKVFDDDGSDDQGDGQVPPEPPPDSGGGIPWYRPLETIFDPLDIL